MPEQAEAQPLAAEQIARRQRMDALAVAGAKPALEVHGPRLVGSGRDRQRRSGPWRPAPGGSPPINPSFFAERCRLRDAKAGHWGEAPNGGERWTAGQLPDWLQADANAERSQHFELSPEGWRLEGAAAIC
jgi:hypothetical protein